MPEDVVEEFYEACGHLRGVFRSLTDSPGSIDIGEKCVENIYIDVFVLDYASIHPQQILALLPDVQGYLQGRKNYWRVRILLSTTGGSALAPDTCAWVELDRYETMVFTGRRDIEIFDDIWAMFTHFWGSKISQELRDQANRAMEEPRSGTQEEAK